jgi:hypothetical protein
MSVAPWLKYKIAAKGIITEWVSMMEAREVGYDMLQGGTVEEWLLAASEDSRVMHDNTDANVIFDRVLRKHRLIRGGRPMDFEETWDAVTATGLLELAAEVELLRRGGIRTGRAR